MYLFLTLKCGVYALEYYNRSESSNNTLLDEKLWI